MIHQKRFLFPTLLAAVLCSLPMGGLRAQGPGGDHHGPPHGPPPPSPLFDALDTNHDGVIDASEIANAPTSLKTLLKNGATQLTREDVRPPHPPHPPHGPDDSARADDAQGRPRFDPHGIRPHNPPPADAPSADETPASAPAANDPRASGPLHRPPPPADGSTAADGTTPKNPPADNQAEPARHHHAPPSPLFDALDSNHDGVISADEMNNAAESLKKLDRTGSGQIKREDLRASPPPPRPND